VAFVRIEHIVRAMLCDEKKKSSVGDEKKPVAYATDIQQQWESSLAFDSKAKKSTVPPDGAITQHELNVPRKRTQHHANAQK
jgi:hypothetical protein